MLKFSLRELVLLVALVAVALAWYLDHRRQQTQYAAIAAEHMHLYVTTHVYRDMVRRSKCDLPMDLDLAVFTIAAGMAGDPLPKLQSWPVK